MSHLIKDTFYKEKLYQLSLTSFSQAETVLNKEKTKIKELSKQEIPQEIVEQSLGNFGKTAEGPHYSYLSFVCVNQNLYSVAGVERFKHLQHIDISHNNILSLKPLGYLKYVVHLNCSNNKLTKLLDLKKPPLQLMFVDCSHNDIEIIPDLSCHRFLKSLNLSYNRIVYIEGFSNNQYLQTLNLGNNQIEYIENLDDMNLVDLNLSANRISDMKGLNKLPRLRRLDLSQNTIFTIRGLVDLISLRELYISENLVKRVRELRYLENLAFLSALDLNMNPIQDRRYYRLQVLYRLPGLRNLDKQQVTPEDVVKAENLYGMDLEDRKAIFKINLPEEEFIDRRMHISDMIEPETDSDNDQDDFIDQYDKEGNLIEKKQKTQFDRNSQQSLSEMYHTGKSLQEKPDLMTVKSYKSQQV